jgi:hypothetical protein
MVLKRKSPAFLMFLSLPREPSTTNGENCVIGVLLCSLWQNDGANILSHLVALDHDMRGMRRNVDICRDGTR